VGRNTQPAIGGSRRNRFAGDLELALKHAAERHKSGALPVASDAQVKLGVELEEASQVLCYVARFARPLSVDRGLQSLTLPLAHSSRNLDDARLEQTPSFGEPCNLTEPTPTSSGALERDIAGGD